MNALSTLFLVVQQWDDDEPTRDPSIRALVEERDALKAANKQVFRPSRKHRDKWDMELDRGRTKKVKAKQTDGNGVRFGSMHNSYYNGFQSLANRAAANCKKRLAGGNGAIRTRVPDEL